MKTVFADAQLDARVEISGGGGVEHRPEGQHQRVDAERMALHQLRRARAPTAEGHDHALEIRAPFGELVHPRGGGRREFAAADDPRFLQLLEALGEDVRADARQTGAEVGETLRTEDQLANDQEGPPLADEVEGVGRRASIFVAASGCHDRKFKASSSYSQTFYLLFRTV